MSRSNTTKNLPVITMEEHIEPGLVPVAEAVDKSGYSRNRIHELLELGYVSGAVFKERILVSMPSLKHWVDNHGRPRD